MPEQTEYHPNRVELTATGLRTCARMLHALQMLQHVASDAGINPFLGDIALVRPTMADLRRHGNYGDGYGRYIVEADIVPTQSHAQVYAGSAGISVFHSPSGWFAYHVDAESMVWSTLAMFSGGKLEPERYRTVLKKHGITPPRYCVEVRDV